MNIPIAVEVLTFYQKVGIVGIISAVCYRAYIVYAKKRDARKSWIEHDREWKRDLTARLDALDKGEFARINLLHKLVKDEIKSSKDAAVKAEGAQKTADTILQIIKKK